MSISSKRRGDHLGPMASVEPFPHQVHQDFQLVKQCYWTGASLLKDEKNGCSHLKRKVLTIQMIIRVPIYLPKVESFTYLSPILLPFFSCIHQILDSLFQS